MTAPRVALYTDADVFAGTERHMLDLAWALRDEGVGVCIACPAPSPLAHRAAESDLPVVAIAKRGLVDWVAAAALRRLLRSGALDLVHAHNGRTALAAALAVRAAGVGHFVATQHFLEPDHLSRQGLPGLAFRLAHRWVNDRTGHFIAVGEAARKRMVERGDATPACITVVPNGIAAPDHGALASPMRVRGELGIAEGTPLVTCAARLEREKDVGSLIAAMAELVAACPAAVCVIAGEGSQRPALAAQIRQHGLENRVRLLGYRQDVHAILNAGDMCVLPSLAEPFGLVLLEAMALGKPVVATRAGGPVEIVVEGETGLLVPPSDPVALGQAILALLRDPATGTEMGRKGHERFQECYTVERMARATRAVYERVLGVAEPAEVTWTRSVA